MGELVQHISQITKAKVYVLSIPPITYYAEADYDNALTTSAINEYNTALKSVIKGTKAKFLDFHSVLTLSLIHILNPIVGSEKQSEDLVRYLLREFEENPTKIWESNIFGKSLHELVNEGLHNKLSRMPDDARAKLQEAIQRIINDGCNGLICLIL